MKNRYQILLVLIAAIVAYVIVDRFIAYIVIGLLLFVAIKVAWNWKNIVRVWNTVFGKEEESK